MNLSESYKKRLKQLADIPLILEDIHPQFMDFGFYDISNGNSEILLDELKKENIEYIYDALKNFTKIITNNPRSLKSILSNAKAIKIPLGQEKELFENPNDCVLIQSPPVNIPKGAMM